MADLVVIVPSRGRPDAADELALTFAETCTANTVLVVAIDGDDPAPYSDAAYVAQQSGTMVSALNAAAKYVLETVAPFAIGFMGDDHRPRMVGWDQAYLDALHELGTGIVYGNDLLQGERLPTQVAMTADIVKALGYMAVPTLRHMYVDNFWRELGGHAHCLRYLPDVVVEHLHPVVNKAKWDDGYKRVNAASVYQHDAVAYEAYIRSSFGPDVAKVRAL